MKGLVWFKKDLRFADHRPLYEASHKCSEVKAIYIFEDAWFMSYEFHPSHLQFINESLAELKIQLNRINVQLVIRYGDTRQIFQDIKSEFDYKIVFAHQETGQFWTYKRDVAVIDYFQDRSIQFKEYYNFAVVRRLKDRDLWNNYRKKIIERKLIPEPQQLYSSAQLKSDGLLNPLDSKFSQYKIKANIQSGGESQAQKTLESFLSGRGQTYLEHISNPLLAEHSGSRLSPYITYGNLSLTQIHHKLKKALLYHNLNSKWNKSLWAFENRLWWHCHFIQKLESEYKIEFQNVNRAFDGLRESEFNSHYFEAWKSGQTGFPLVDACMRCLLETGWINFRMRAMLVSFASYQLWLHWQKPAEFLAAHFLDYEPGIHFSQFQMQSGVTGINAIRIYSPQKQTNDHEHIGDFIRKYCPELSLVPDEYLHDLESMPPLLRIEAQLKLGENYPLPVVDAKESYQLAKKRIFEWKKAEAVKLEALNVLKKHASRTNTSRRFPKQKRT